MVRRWSLPGDPHGIAVGADGTIYVGLAEPQAVVAIDPATGQTKKKVVLDSAEIASTKELVTLRTDRKGSRLFIANGSDESATILSIPNLAIVREITIEGEEIRDALPDPSGRFLYVLGRRVHVYDFAGENELRTLPIEEATAIAASDSRLVVFDQKGFTVYNTANFTVASHRSLPAVIRAAMFSGDKLLAAADDALFTITNNTIARQPICLPHASGPQIAMLATALLTDGCASKAFAADARGNALYATERRGYLTIYRVPR